VKIVLFGATGKTGKYVLQRALMAGHEVVALVRKPETIAQRPGLTIRQGDVFDFYAVKTVVAGADIAICAIGPAKNSDPGTVISVSAKNIVAGCTDAKVKRLVFQSGMMVSDGSELSLGGYFMGRMFRVIYPKLYEDKVTAENTVKNSKLEWVIVRPPALKEEPTTGKYLVGPRVRVSPSTTLAFDDCADVLLKAATEPQWVNQIINCGY
jgi:putative NADH-flavin reductase